MAFKYKFAVLGGTFDHLHKGHKKLLKYGLNLSEKLIIGLTSDDYIEKLKANNEKLITFESFETRKKVVETYLNKITPGRFEITQIDDLFGPTLDKDFFAETIIVSADTRKASEKINIERERIGLSKFEIVQADTEMAEDGVPISSERIRNGEIDRDGKLCIRPDWKRTNQYITDELKEELRKPWGQLLKAPSVGDGEFVICVGDETSKVFNRSKIEYKISVVDFKIARKKAVSSFLELGFSGNEKVYSVKNPAGSITSELFKTAINVVKNKTMEKQIIKIEGEDDLAVLPLILASPLDCMIFYGQPGEGLVKIRVSENIKARAYKIMARFQTLGY